MFCPFAAAGAVRQRGPEGEGLPQDHPASDLWKVPGVASFHQEADQQHFLTVGEAFKGQEVMSDVSRSRFLFFLQPF